MMRTRSMSSCPLMMVTPEMSTSSKSDSSLQTSQHLTQCPITSLCQVTKSVQVQERKEEDPHLRSKIIEMQQENHDQVQFYNSTFLNFYYKTTVLLIPHY